MTRLPALFLAPIALVFAAITIGGLTAQTPAPQASFTAAQVDAGRAAYDTHCSGCHLRDLQGQFEAPQLAGANFLNQWGDKTVAELHTHLMTSMPPNDPGGPGSQTMTAIIAYIMQANGARAGSQALTAQTGATIRSAIAARATTTAAALAPATAPAPPPGAGGSTSRKGV